MSQADINSQMVISMLLDDDNPRNLRWWLKSDFNFDTLRNVRICDDRGEGSALKVDTPDDLTEEQVKDIRMLVADLFLFEPHEWTIDGVQHLYRTFSERAKRDRQEYEITQAVGNYFIAKVKDGSFEMVGTTNYSYEDAASRAMDSIARADKGNTYLVLKLEEYLAVYS